MMHNLSKFITKFLLAFILLFPVVVIYNGAVSVIAEAAVTDPSLTESKKILFVNYETYKITYNNLSGNAKIVYKSSNSNTAKVNSCGMVTPVSKGTATITAKVNQDSKTYKLKVKITVKTPCIKLIKSTSYLNVGDSYTMKAAEYGINEKIVWSASDDSIVHMKSNGRITALKNGKAAVYAKAGGKIAKCFILIGSNRIGTFSKDITCYKKTTIWISLADRIENEKLTAINGNKKILSLKMGNMTDDDIVPLTLTPEKIGTDTIEIISNKTRDKLYINVKVIKKPVLKELTAKEVYRKCKSSTVEIIASSPDLGISQGSGFFLNNSMVVTNYHVIEGAEEIVITALDNKQYKVHKILGYSETLDLAVLEVDADNGGITISSNNACVGETVYALGSPFGFTGTMSDGIVSTASRVFDDVKYIQTTASISQGNSGGPLINSYGEVIGINTMTYIDGQNLNFSINISELQKINTNRPITLSNYYTLYEKKQLDEFLDNVIYEDPQVSQNPQTCQNIVAGAGVEGTLKQGEQNDYYCFTVSEAGWFTGLIESQSATDMQNTNYKLYDKKGNMLSPFSEEKGDVYQYIYYYLLPGTYYMSIYRPQEYTGNDIPYMLLYDYNG